MLDEREVAEEIKEHLRNDHFYDPEYHVVEFDGLPESESGFVMTLLDGTKFIVVVTKIVEGE